LFRKTVLPGLFALACLPFVEFWFNPAPARVVLLSFWAGLVLLAHRRNFVEEFALLTARRDHNPQTEQPPL
jgi:hypothetical protein